MTKKYFNNVHSEHCFDKRHFIDKLKEMNKDGVSIDSIPLTEAIMVTGASFFYCSYWGEPGEVGEGCGKECKQYKPRNGKNGRCVYSKNCYEQGDAVTLNSNGTIKKNTPNREEQK